MNLRVNYLQNIWRLALVLFLLIGSLGLQPAQPVMAAEVQNLWAKAMSGTGNEYGVAIAVDASGCVYVTGAFEDTVDFDPGAGITELTSAGFEDIFVAKLDHNGDLLWAKAVGGTGYDASTAIAVDASGNVFVTGFFEGIVDFDPGTGFNVMTSAGDDDIFILKLDSDGNLAWVKILGGVLDDSSNGIAVDGYENVYVTGYFRATVDFDPGAGTVELTSAGSDDIFISKLDSDGNYLWAAAIGGTGVDVGAAIAVDPFGEVYITGSFEATVDFDPGAGTAVLTSAGASDIFVSKLDANGGHEWATQISGTSDSDWGSAIVVDESSSVYVTGILYSADNFISKLDSNGNKLWTVAVMGSGVWGGIDGVTISVDNVGNVYTCGYFFGTVDFDPGSDSYELTGTGSNYDIFVEKFNNNGNFLWVESIGDVGFDICTDIVIDDFGNLYTTGAFEGTFDFDPGVGVSELTSVGEDDVFVSKLKGADVALNAPLDVVLVIDASDSMTYDAEIGDPMRDPSQCNPLNNCHPFEDIKSAAAAFVEKLNFPNDRLAVVTFDDGAHVDLGFSDNKVDILAAIGNLGVIEPDICPTASGPCRLYERDPTTLVPTDLNSDGIIEYYGFDCPIYFTTRNPSTCTTTAIGQGLLFTGNEFNNVDTFREGSRRVVILLTDGAANAPAFVCPNSTWTSPFCRDLSLSRHCLYEDDISCLAAGGIYDPDNYDADDYARDMADFLSEDQGALVYAIGLGDLIRTSLPRARIDDPTQKCSEAPPDLVEDPIENCYGAGEQLLRYAAEMGNGAYYFAPSGDQLEEIFQDIYSHLTSGPKTWIVTKADDTDDGSCDGDCSLREAIASASAGDTVAFAPSLAGQTIALASTITINTSLAIDGSNLAAHVQVSGDTDNNGVGDTSVFMIAAGTVVEIADLEIIAGHYTEALAAGGINNYGDLTLANCSFSGNTGDQGGAVHNKGSLTVSNCSFIDNTAIEGGAVFNDIDNTCLISESTFTNNTATDLDGIGGAAGAVANVGTLTVYDSVFTNNSADAGGGAIVNSATGSTTVQGSTFTGNIALMDIDFSNVNFPGYGGAIYNYSGTLTVNNSTFSNNVADGGAAISIGNNNPNSTEESQLTIENSTFSGNTAGFVGGGVNISYGTATISTSTFINNSAEGGGGVMNGGSLTLVSTTFDSNTGGEGGGVFNFGSLTIDKSNFFQNVAAIIVGGEGSGAAGAVLNWGIASISGSTFSGNSAEGGGGAIGNSNNGDLYGGTLNMTDSIFTNNSTPKYGGAIYNYSGALSVSGSTFTDNTAEYGGAINVGNFDNIPTDGNVTIDHSLFSGNTASYIAGGVHIFKMDATISGCTFVNNSAEYGGGLVAILGTHNINNSTFYNNSSSEDPGGGIVNGGSLTLTNSTFSDNIGGGLYNLPDSSLGLRNNILANSPSVVDCYNEGTFISETHNLIELNGNGEFACGTPLSTDDPLLGPLADNGGPTWTMSLLPGSPAIDAGDDGNCLSGDQRGVARPQGNHCDIGAYELIDNTSPTALSVTRVDPSPTSAADVDFTVTFSEAVTGVDASDFALTVTGVTGASVSGVSGSGATYTVTVDTGSGAGTIRLDVKSSGTGIEDLVGNPLSGGFTTGEVYTIIIVNNPPAIALSNTVTALPENADSSSAIKVADIAVTDDGIGSNVLTLSGADAALFKITGMELFIKAGTVFDFETNPVLNVTIEVDDSSVGTSPDDTDSLSIVITDIDEIAPTVASVTYEHPDLTNAASVDFTVTFSEAVAGVDSNDFSLTTTGVTGASIVAVTATADAAVYTVTVDTGSGEGTIRLDVVDDDSIVDEAGNPLGGFGTASGFYTVGEICTIQKHNADTTGVFRPSNGLLYLKNSNTTGYADIAINYGLAGDYPVTGDWDGNGTDTIGIYRNGSFYLRNSNTLGFADIVFPFGTPGDQPIAGDWNGDGIDTIGVYRPSTGQFLLRNSNSAGTANMSFYLGNVGDVGIAGDWNGDGIDTTGVFRPSNGVIFLKNTNSTGFADIALNYGLPGDRPVTGDWNNDGIDTIGVYRNGQFMLRNSNTIGFADIVFGLGNPGDMPISGDWDGIP